MTIIGKPTNKRNSCLGGCTAHCHRNIAVAGLTSPWSPSFRRISDTAVLPFTTCSSFLPEYGCSQRANCPQNRVLLNVTSMVALVHEPSVESAGSGGLENVAVLSRLNDGCAYL